ncbi:hypothetical protein BV911_06380 [Pseudoruegeria sp. SK021]|nr:hypothetical protein BV911_06380 [Pseudoruegeria sp. SK021]
MCLSLVSHAVAQTVSGQTARTTARIVTDLEANDNYDLSPTSPGNSFLWNTTVGASLNSRTLTDTLFLDAQGTARVADLPGQGTETLFDDPRLTLRFTRATDDSSLYFNLALRRYDLDFFDPLGDLNPDGTFDDSNSDGNVETVRSTFGGFINQNGPLSFKFDGLLFQRKYYDLSGSSTESNDNLEEGFLNGEFGVLISPILRWTFGGGYDVQDVGDSVDTHRTRKTLDTGFDGSINPALDVSVRLGYSEVLTEKTTGDETASGVVGRVDFTRTVPDGEHRFGFSSRVDENGERYDVTYGRSRQLLGGALSYNLGASSNADTNVRAIGNIDYTYLLPRSQIGMNIVQNTTVDDEGENIIVSRAAIDYSYLVTPLSSFDLSLNAGLTRYDADDQPDESRVNLTAQYTRVLTPDWSGFAGYRHQMKDYDTSSEANSNAVFIGLRRDFASIR